MMAKNMSVGGESMTHELTFSPFLNPLSVWKFLNGGFSDAP